MPALRDVRLVVVAAPRVERSLRSVADVVATGAVDSPADLVLVEPGAPGAARAAEAAQRRGIPCAAWLRDPAGALAVPAADLRRCDAVFVTDPALAAPLERLTGRRPAPLPEAASSDALAATRSPRREPWLALLPGAEDDRGFARLLVAARGLDTRELPADPAAAAAMLRHCAALLATQAAGASQLHIPGAVFDAVAMRTPVVVPANRGAALMLTGIVPRAVGPRQAAAFVREAVARGEAPPLGATVIRNAHTYAHRLAGVASALGIRVLPVPTTKEDAEGAA